jgi:hypothetical protein
LLHEELSLTSYGFIMSAWLLIVLGLFAYPLSAFRKPLAELKNESKLVAGAQATRFHRASERESLGRNIVANEPEEASATEEPSDPSKNFELARKLLLV